MAPPTGAGRQPGVLVATVDGPVGQELHDPEPGAAGSRRTGRRPAWRSHEERRSEAHKEVGLVGPELAVLEECSEDAWVRVRMHVESLDWVPALLASLNGPLVVETPEALREGFRGLARRLDDACL